MLAASVASLCLFFNTQGCAPAGYLARAVKGPDGKMRQETVPYVPREGDLVFFDDHSVMWTILFAWAGTGPPLHMGIVVKRADGTPAILEAGPDDSIHVYLLDLKPRLEKFKGTISIRRCKVPLDKDKSAALSKFAKEQEGKRYAVVRLLLQGTWLRCRGPVRELFLAETCLDRSSWICSELSVAAGTIAGLFDPRVVRANVTYPRDIVDNHRFNLGRTWQEPVIWQRSVEPGKR